MTSTSRLIGCPPGRTYLAEGSIGWDCECGTRLFLDLRGVERPLSGRSQCSCGRKYVAHVDEIPADEHGPGGPAGCVELLAE